ncbi:UNVERIFIED_CONTAM: hypothetical protein K2H54_001297 [Gekko kuhli]
MPPGAILGKMTPNSRMAVIRARRQWVSALQRVGEHLLEQANRQFEAMMVAAQREHEDFVEQMRLSREEEQATTVAMDDIMCGTLDRLGQIAILQVGAGHHLGAGILPLQFLEEELNLLLHPVDSQSLGPHRLPVRQGIQA